MKIKVGSYEVNGDFKSKTDAKKIFLSHFPAVTEKDLDTELDKLFDNEQSNQSDDATSENTDGDKQHAETGSGGVGKKQPRKDKY